MMLLQGTYRKIEPASASIIIYWVGIKDKDIEQRNKKLVMRYPEESYTISNPVYFLMLSTIANGSFNNAQTTSASSSSLAGGGTGVGGGLGAF